MAAPVPVPRGVPAGSRLRDGFRTTITFSSMPDANFWEIGVKPPTYDGGDPVDCSTMLNDLWHTMSPRFLIKMDASTITAAYDPQAFNVGDGDLDEGDLAAIINNEDTITITFPDTSTLSFFGFLQKFEPSELKEGEFPTATLTIVPTNTDPTTGDEADPVFTEALPLAERKKMFKHWRQQRRIAKQQERKERKRDKKALAS